MVSTRLHPAGDRFAVESYVHFVRERSLLEAVASSPDGTVLAADHRRARRGMLGNYDYIDAGDAGAYFSQRPPQAARDVSFALDYVKRHARTPEQQQAVLDALPFKCDVLWTQLDALLFAYVAPGMIPPGAFRPEAMNEPG